jgi:2-dehydro-3-deoxyphosphogluconate aldolase / (4S)-4-hydroxy-2-oxoglutarate aldolase
MSLSHVLSNPLVPVYFNADPKAALEVLQASYSAGLRVFEFTNRGAEAQSVFKELKSYAEANCPDLLLGIGTIVKPQDAEPFLKMGVDFIVQPGTTAEIGKLCAETHTFWIPGVMTPTEIYAAQDLGATLVKVFPANILGSAYIKALRGPMPNLKIMVTGGIEPTAASLHEWFGAGANLLGLGSQLFKNISDLAKFKSDISELNTLFKSTYLKQ